MSVIYPGRPYPRGPQWDGAGTNFSLFSENAVKVELLLFDSSEATKPTQIVTLPEKTASTWHCYLPGIGPGQHYAYRVHGPFEPLKGHRFNSNKALIDPYAKAIAGDVQWDNALYGYKTNIEDDSMFANTIAKMSTYTTEERSLVLFHSSRRGVV